MVSLWLRYVIHHGIELLEDSAYIWRASGKDVKSMMLQDLIADTGALEEPR